MSDRDLLLALLKAGLTDQQIEVFGGQLAELELFGKKLSPVIRRHAECIARAKGILSNRPSFGRDREKRNEWHRADDMYSARRTAGTEVAERILSRRPLTPPRKAG